MEDVAVKIFDRLTSCYPNLKHYLNFNNPLQLLVATILSAQTRDDTVNRVTPDLFEKYKSVKDYACADPSEVSNLISSVTYAKNKSVYVVEACKILDDKFNGNVPDKIDDLVTLPGIGRKSANAILQNAFNVVDGIVVDTHVLRVCYRLGLISNPKNALKSEKELMSSLPKTYWRSVPGLMKRHGRAVCRAGKPLCTECVVSGTCPKKGV